MANNVVSDQMKNAQVNSFTGGINTDLHPMLQPSDTLTDCVNGTLITYNGNENMLQNDMGNYALEGAKLPVNYVPIGVKEYAGILYIVAYNPVDKKVQVGSYPSPKVTFDDPGEGSCTIEITPYNIKQFVPSESAKGIDPFDVLSNEKLEGESEKGAAYHLHSNVVKSASNLLTILGDFSDSNFQLTVNDQYKLVLTVDAENSEWMQSLKYFSFTKDGKLEDITDMICVDSVETDEFRNVVWQSPGWLGVKYELADIVKSHQAINNVSYPTHGRTTNTLWTNEEEDNPTFGKIQVATGDLSKDFNYYEDPHVMIPEGNYMIKYYWNNVTPESNDTIVYYSKQLWQVSDENSVISHFDDGNWHTVRFNGVVENIADWFSRFDYTDESLYVFLPPTAYIDESKNKLFGDSTKLFVFIHNKNDRNFTLKTSLKFINKTKEMRLHAEDVYIRELYCPIYDDSLYVSPEKVDYIILDEATIPIPEKAFANIITKSLIFASRPRTYRTIEYQTIDNTQIDLANTWDGLYDEHKFVDNIGYIILKNGVDYIPEKAFYDTEINILNIPTCIKTICSAAFQNCHDLYRIDVPDTVQQMATDAFLGFDETTNTMTAELSLSGIDGVVYVGKFLVDAVDSESTVVAIKEGTKWIGDCAFRGNKDLTKIEIPESVESIGRRAFENCEFLKNIIIPNSVNSFGDNLFGGCKSLSSLDGDVQFGSYLYRMPNASENVIIPDNIKAIGENAFADNEDITTITMSNNVLYVGDFAFSGCTALTKVTFGTNITYIGKYAFGGCESLSSITLPPKLDTVRPSTFSGCTNLQYVSLPLMVRGIDEYAFENCGITAIVFPSHLKYIDDSAFARNPLSGIVFCGDPTYISQDAFFGVDDKVEVYYRGYSPEVAFELPPEASIQARSEECVEDIKKLWENKVSVFGFEYDKQFIYIELHDNKYRVSSKLIEDLTLSWEEDNIDNASNVQEVVLPTGITTIGVEALCHYSNVKRIEIPDSVTHIEVNAFPLLDQISFGSSIQEINTHAFDYSSYLDIYIKDLESWCQIKFDSAVSNPLYNPGSNLYLYGDSIEEPNKNRITEVEWPETLDTIKDYVFYGYDALKKITARGRINSVGDLAVTNDAIVELYNISDSAVISEDAWPNASIYIATDRFEELKSRYFEFNWKWLYSNVYFTGVDSSLILGSCGELRSIEDSDVAKYILPYSWQFRSNYSANNLFNSDYSQKQPRVKKGDYLDNIPTKYIYNVVSPLNAEPLNENIIGWRIDSDVNFKLFAQGDVANITLPIESVVDGQWLRITHKPYVDPETVSTTANICWKNGDEILNIGTGESLVFTVNAEARIRKDSWKEYDNYDVKWRLRLYAETNENKQYFAEFVTSVDDNGRLICAPFYEKTVAVGNQGNFQELQGSFDFNAAIPEGLKNIYAESVFYCVETGVENPRVLIFDNTLQKDVLTLPEYATLDYSDADIIGFTYDVKWDASKKQHNINCVLNYNTIVDGFQVNAILSNINGTEQVSGDNSSGYSMEQTIKFECPETIQFAQLDVFVSGVNKFNKTILINSEINNPRWSRTDMSTNDWGKVIDAILNDSENEWKLNVSVEVDSEAAQSEPCSYKVEDSKLVDLTYYPEDNLPAKAVPIVDENGQMPGFEGYTLADIVYAPMKITATLGAGIQINGTISGATVELDNGSSKYFEFDSPYTLGQKVNKLLPLGFNNVKLTADTDRAVIGIPIRERLLKYMYKPTQFDELLNMCNISGEDKKLFEDYWVKDHSVLAHQGNSIEFDLIDKDGNVETSRLTLNACLDELPMIFPIQFKQEDSDHGITMPISLYGKEKVKMYLEGRVWNERSTTEIGEAYRILGTYTVVDVSSNTKWAIALQTDSTEQSLKFGWFGQKALLHGLDYAKKEKELFLAGLAVCRVSYINTPSQHQHYIATSEVDQLKVYRVDLQSTQTTWLCGNLCGHCNNIQLKHNKQFIFKTTHRAESALYNNLIPYECKYENHFLNKLASVVNFTEPVPYISAPEFNLENTPIKKYLRVPGDGFHEVCDPVIGWGRGRDPIHSYDLNIPEEGAYESVYDNSNLSSAGAVSALLYPWPISNDDIFCQIPNQFVCETCGSESEKINAVTINNETKTIDEWIKIYLKELVEELRYANKYKNSN